MNRILDVVFEPLFHALVALVLAYALRRRWPRVAFAMPAIALAELLFFACPPIANRLQRGLEEPAMTSIKGDVTYDAVIVLGGAMNGTVTADTGMPAFNESAERVLAAFDLLRTNRARFAILSGSSWGSDRGEAEPESRLMAKQLAAWGIDPARLATDEVSRTTHENAIESVRIARERGWRNDVLVTSAAHMARARGCFAREGLAVDTLAVDFLSYDPARHTGPVLPRAGALTMSSEALRERIGRVIYRVRGWSE